MNSIMKSWNVVFLIILFILVVVLLTGCGGAPAATPTPTMSYYVPERLVLAVAPFRAAPATFELWTPLVDFISAQVNMPVNLVTTDSYEDFIGMVLETLPDFMYINNMHYLELHKQAGYNAVVSLGIESVGLIIVPKNSPIYDIADLRGKTLAFLPPSAFSAHLQPKVFLYDYGLVSNQDYTILQLDNLNLIMDFVLDNKAQAGGTSKYFFESLPEETSAQFRILVETPPQPPAPFAVRGDMQPDMLAKITRALLAMNDSAEGQAILEAMGWGKLLPANDDIYDVTREFARKLGMDY